MAIDVFSETVVSLADATKKLPKLRNGKRIHVSSIYRWAMAGKKTPDGRIARLETVKVGGTTCTSLEALQRYFDRLTGMVEVVTPPTRTLRRRLREIKAAEEELKRLGM